MPSCTHSWTWPDTPEVRALGLGVAALDYARWGYAVLPLVPGGKKPHPLLGERGGVHWATTAPGTVCHWWRADPAANIGVACGSASGLCVVDLDVKAGADGRRELEAFFDEHHVGLATWPLPPAVATPSGGQHLWLRTPPGTAVPERPGILPGVDVKGDGGYVVAPPSGLMVHADGRDGEHGGMVGVPYSWVSGCPCSAPRWPDWVPGWLATAPRTAGGASGGPVDLDAAVAQGFPRGTRNVSMYRTACSLFRTYGTSAAGVAAVSRRCRAIWDAGDKSDYDWHEVQVTIESARKFIAASEEAERSAAAGFTGWAGRHGA